MFDIRPYAKAVVGFVAPGVVALVQAVSDASPAGGAITTPEWVGIGAAMILTSAAVYAVPNATVIARGYHSGVREPYNPKHDRG